MSVDDRLREAFASTDHEWERSASSALRAVTARHDRERRLRRGGGAVLAAAAAVAVVAVVASDRANDAEPAPVGPPPTGPTQTEASPTGVPSSPLDGRWKSGPMGEADVQAALTASGHAEFAEEILAALPEPPFRLVWVVHGDGSELEVVHDGEVEVLDEEDLEVTEDVVTMSPRFGPGVTVHQWELVGDELRLTFVSTTEGRTEGVAGEAWQRLLYDSVVFQR